MGSGNSTRPGPDWEQHYMNWEQHYMKELFHTPWNYLASPEIKLAAA
jgi:hypothetical protein